MISTFRVNNIKCGGCENSIKKSILKIEGVEALNIDLDSSDITLEYAEESTLEKVKNKLNSMGYPEDDPSLAQNVKSYISCAIGRVSPEK